MLKVDYSARVWQYFLKINTFSSKTGFFCLMVMKFCGRVKAISTQLLIKKNLQILLKSSAGHALKNLIFN